jgi:glycosyltransferase involved in cell wall biosynthesis
MTAIRVCIVQPVVAAYNTPFFNLIGSAPDIDLHVWAGMAAPSAPPSDLTDNFTDFTFRVAPTKKVGPFFWQPLQWEAVTNQQFDVVALSWNSRYPLLLPCVFAARWHRVGTLMWGHGTTPRDSRLRRGIREGIGRRANGCVLYTDTVADDLLDRGFPADKLFVAPNAIDQAPLRSEADAWLNSPGRLESFRIREGIVDRDVVLFVSRLRRNKRPQMLLDAVHLLSQHRPRILLTVIGAGEDRASLEAQARRLGIAGNVRFLGPIYDQHLLAPWFLSSVAFAMPCSIGLSIFTAFGYGLPVVTSAGDQTPEFTALRPGWNGLLHEMDDAQSVADALELLLSNPPLCMTMSTNARATVSPGSTYTIESMAEGMASAIRTVAQRTRETSR